MVINEIDITMRDPDIRIFVLSALINGFKMSLVKNQSRTFIRLERTESAVFSTVQIDIETIRRNNLYWAEITIGDYTEKKPVGRFSIQGELMKAMEK